ncbi:MAG: hypothetical protein H6581_02640 [Bacteroidia bacterium]|nr:hypothetical protein [Bacteroidia bacterium]
MKPTNFVFPFLAFCFLWVWVGCHSHTTLASKVGHALEENSWEEILPLCLCGPEGNIGISNRIENSDLSEEGKEWWMNAKKDAYRRAEALKFQFEYCRKHLQDSFSENRFEYKGHKNYSHFTEDPFYEVGKTDLIFESGSEIATIQIEFLESFGPPFLLEGMKPGLD